MQGTPLPRPDVEDLINKNVFTNKSGKIDGDLLAKVLQYIQASAPNILTDGLLGGPGGPNPDYLAVLRALQLKADQSFVVSELGKKEPRFTGLLAQDLQPSKAGFAGLLLYQLLAKIVNEGGGAAIDTPLVLRLSATQWYFNHAAQALYNAGTLAYVVDDGTGFRIAVSSGTQPTNSPAANSAALTTMAAGLAKP